ncbi:L-rhamnose mutarotase [Frigidibacter sp. ROC022]|uniref:L-rhamnose mutarotase n=1 Tax=Frigidibacter sp. ROC022 TaxID=2971796 RepID=UPI00215ABD47|nr:L-rhamnose mutarotase [Frigidibacter sp. ROC022]MCR8724669.1 L-rhamnose mutarotase [Frigidibacter sp. ROC022]
MARRAFVMKLRPGCEAEYAAKHDAIWPELVEQMRARGTRNYSIYRYGLLLFAYQENDGPAGEPTDLTRRWWQEMAPLMETDANGAPWRETLSEVFHLD